MKGMLDVLPSEHRGVVKVAAAHLSMVGAISFPDLAQYFSEHDAQANVAPPPAWWDIEALHVAFAAAANTGAEPHPEVGINWLERKKAATDDFVAGQHGSGNL